MNTMGHYAVAAFVGLGGTGLVVWAMKKWLVPAYAKKVSAIISKAMHPDTADPKLNELLRAHALTGIRLAEYLIPDRGKGGERFAMVDAYLAKFHIPDDIRKLIIEEGVGVMDDELKKAASENA